MSTEMNGIDVVVDFMVYPISQRLLAASILQCYDGPRRVYLRKASV